MGNCMPKIRSYEEVPRDYSSSEEELETIFEATEEGRRRGSNFVAWRARMDQLIQNLRNRQDKIGYTEI
jgi:hypothetical protein